HYTRFGTLETLGTEVKRPEQGKRSCSFPMGAWYDTRHHGGRTRPHPVKEEDHGEEDDLPHLSRGLSAAGQAGDGDHQRYPAPGGGQGILHRLARLVS